MNAPPNEWPMMIGGASSSRMIAVVVIDDLLDAEVLDRARVGAQLLWIDIHAGPGGGEDVVAARS